MMRGLRAPFWIAFSLSFPSLLGLSFLLTLRSASDRRALSEPSSPLSPSAFVDGELDLPPGEQNPEYSILAAIQWLARHQFTDGMWSSRTFHQMCIGRICPGGGRDSLDTALTGLAVLGILESGLASAEERTHSASFSAAADRGLNWLAERQEADGSFGLNLYEHSIATLAFCRAYSAFSDPVSKHHARLGIRFLEAARNPNGAWGYGCRDGRSNTSITFWAGAALLAALSIDIECPPDSIRALRRWLDDMTGSAYYEVSYDRRGGGPSSIRGRNDRFETNDTLTALAAFLRHGLGVEPHDPRILHCGQRLSWNLPVWNRSGTSVDFYYWYAGMLALAKVGGELRDRWSGRVQLLLAHRQRTDACAEGSWDPVDKWGCEGGRIYATAINALTLSLARADRNR